MIWSRCEPLAWMALIPQGAAPSFRAVSAPSHVLLPLTTLALAPVHPLFSTAPPVHARTP